MSASSFNTGSSTETTGSAAAASSTSLSSRVSVILVLWNCEQELPRCLGSLRAAGGGSVEVVCVDNASEDGSTAVARKHGATVLEMGANAGFPAAVNAGLAAATAPYVLLLNPDVELAPDTVVRCLDVLERDPGVGMVGCNLRRVDGSPDWAAARRFRSLSSVALETFGLTRLSKRLDFQYFPQWARTDSRDVDCINGAFMLMRTALLRELGGLDETVFMYLEDQDLCRRVWDRGLRVRFVADAVATHVGGASTLRASPGRRTVAYLHRTDADVEMIARRSGRAARLAAIGLFGLRAVLGLLVGVATNDGDLRSKYTTTLSWLARQVGGRTPPPPIA
ncbi:MAG: glycosyltransferase family 2 protein [Actinobacteria bacterium]|nr:glycosyltransferase family 2 protein [Actinomycetota bacterium]